MRTRRSASSARSGVRSPAAKNRTASAIGARTTRSGEAELLPERRHELLDLHPDLGHVVAVADRHRLIGQRIEVDGDAERRPDLVLAAIAAPDGLRLVVRRLDVRAHLRPDRARELAQLGLLRERQDGDLVWRQVAVQPQDDPHAFLVGLLVVRGAQERERRAVRTDRGLDDIRHEPLVRRVVEVLELLPRIFGVALEVVIGPVVEALDLAPPERVAELDVERLRRVERTLLGGVLAEPEQLVVPREIAVPLAPRLLPLLVDPRRVFGPNEVLHLHLLALTRPEDELAGRDLVAERLPDLRDAERQLPAHRLLHVVEIHEDALRRLRPQPGDRRVVLDRADEGLEHEIELPRRAELLLAAVRAGAGHALRQLVEAVAMLAVRALYERIREVLDVPGRLPDLRVHEDRGVEADDVVAELHHRAPPRALHVVLELDAQWPEVPRRARATVDLARGEHEAAAFREGDELVEELRRRGLRHVVAGSERGMRASSSSRRAALMSRSRTYCRNERRCCSSSTASASSTRRSEAPSKLLTKR